MAGNDVERVDDVVGLDRLGEAVEDHQLDLLIERVDAHVAHGRDRRQKDEGDAESEGESGTDFEVLEHEVLLATDT